VLEIGWIGRIAVYVDAPVLVCLVCVPDAMYWIGVTGVFADVVPTMTNVYVAT
jgi:hypothetical protein